MLSRILVPMDDSEHAAYLRLPPNVPSQLSSAPVR